MFLSPPNFVWAIRVKTDRRGSRSGHELAANPARGMLRLPRHVVRGHIMSASDRRRRRRVEPTDEWEREKPLPGSAEAFFLTQAVSTVGTEPAGI